ncbi:unnamed protein product [Danaus chrysippus]|uniref:(African queen) hypothetical protein n=1 Tax=Danaus chrysippus TaxID=151541 RepID=A0A8J2QDI4_9NEOP|nr:unnamed protein product [Danaus chrysippus]
MADAKQSKTEEIYNGSSQSRVVLAKPRLGGFGSSNLLNSSTRSVLRPPQLKPGNNPFLKVNENKPSVDKDKNSNEETGENRQQESKEEEAPKFVPLGSSNSASRSATTFPAPSQATSSSGFVFGQNLSERVVIKESLNNGEASVDHSSSNGTSELLFTSAAASVKENNQTQEEGGLYESGEGLAAAAAEYERSHARPPPPANYCTMTGEEDEINVMQISCRLFAWESGSWRERGRGVLRLNDSPGGSGARLVARVAGSLRVVLNTKLWPDMVVDRAANKSLRITAADAQQQVKLFLIMGTPGDIAQLHRALLSRISLSKRSYNSKEDENSQRSAERLEAATNDNDYTEKNVDSNQEDDEEQENDNQRNEESENRLESSKETSNVREDITEEKESKPMKRKEPVEEETSPKRQCSETH